MFASARPGSHSLDVVLYEMLTGEVPLGRFAPPSQKAQIDVRLDEVVLRTLAREPELRYQRASDLQSEMENISGVLARLPAKVQSALGFEYKSKQTLFGSTAV